MLTPGGSVLEPEAPGDGGRRGRGTKRAKVALARIAVICIGFGLMAPVSLGPGSRRRPPSALPVRRGICFSGVVPAGTRRTGEAGAGHRQQPRSSDRLAAPFRCDPVAAAPDYGRKHETGR